MGYSPKLICFVPMIKAPPSKWFYPILALPLTALLWLPLPVLHGLSDFLRWLGFRVLGYRKEVVMKNLRNSFPEKSEQELNQIAWKFYQNLFDVMIESLAFVRINKQTILDRVELHDLEVIEKYRKSGQAYILVGGHNGNWEWAGQRMHLAGHEINVLYHPLSSKWFDWWMFTIRSRFGVQPVPMQSILRVMVAQKNDFDCYAFIADQTPSSENCHWMEFLNQDTPVFLGVEKMAKKFNLPVVFSDVYRVGRGRYVLGYRLVTDKPQEEPDFFITETHTRLLEQQIHKQPEAWLWSHRRWKHSRKKNDA